MLRTHLSDRPHHKEQRCHQGAQHGWAVRGLPPSRAASALGAAHQDLQTARTEMSLLGQAQAKPLNELTAPAQLGEVIGRCPFAPLIAEFLQQTALAFQERQILCSSYPGPSGSTDRAAQPSLGSHLLRVISAGSQHTQEDPTLQMGFGMSQNCPELLSRGIGDLSQKAPAWTVCAVPPVPPVPHQPHQLPQAAGRRRAGDGNKSWEENSSSPILPNSW